MRHITVTIFVQLKFKNTVRISVCVCVLYKLKVKNKIRVLKGHGMKTHIVHTHSAYTVCVALCYRLE